MTHFHLRVAAAAVLAIWSAAPAQAADVTLEGDLLVHNQVLQFDFSLASAGTDLRIWTDAWMSGLNFDPTAALWARQGSDFSLLAEVDDDDSVAAGQGYYDTGFALPTLAAGQYRLTLAAAGNVVLGSWLSEGYSYDAEAPIAIGDWNQPSYDINANDQKGTFWRLHFSGVDQVSAVPEPASALLLALGGLALLAAGQRRRPSR
jgi:MYXO-CTERM domain-containing protein